MYTLQQLLMNMVPQNPHTQGRFDIDPQLFQGAMTSGQSTTTIATNDQQRPHTQGMGPADIVLTFHNGLPQPKRNATDDEPSFYADDRALASVVLPPNSAGTLHNNVWSYSSHYFNTPGTAVSESDAPPTTVYGHRDVSDRLDAPTPTDLESGSKSRKRRSEASSQCLPRKSARCATDSNPSHAPKDTKSGKRTEKSKQTTGPQPAKKPHVRHSCKCAYCGKTFTRRDNHTLNNHFKTLACTRARALVSQNPLLVHASGLADPPLVDISNISVANQLRPVVELTPATHAPETHQASSASSTTLTTPSEWGNLPPTPTGIAGYVPTALPPDHATYSSDVPPEQTPLSFQSFSQDMRYLPFTFAYPHPQGVPNAAINNSGMYPPQPQRLVRVPYDGAGYPWSGAYTV